jgi:molybdate transport system regulatory protein
VRPDFRIRRHIHVGEEHSLGPGKAALLEAIRATGSISAAARSLGMAYRHAWELVDDLNAGFAPGVVDTAAGGKAGGGAHLTPFGEELLARFRQMEATTEAAIAPELAELASRLAPRRAKKARTKRPRRRRPAHSRPGTTAGGGMRAGALLGLVQCISGPAQADAWRPKETADAPLIREDVAWPRMLHDAAGLPEWLDVAIEQRTRLEYLDERFRPGAADTQSE